MPSFRCNLSLILHLSDNAAEEAEVEEAIITVLRKIRTTQVEFEDIVEIEDDRDDDTESDECFEILSEFD